jgi:O-antigen ligase
VKRSRVTIALIFMTMCALALAISYLSLRSAPLALAVAAAVFAGTVFFIEPFVGLLNYFVFLYIRPQDYAPGLVGMPIMLMISGVTLGLFLLHMAVQKRQIRIARAPQNVIILWLFAAVILSRMAMLDLSGISPAIVDFMPVVIMYFLIANLVTNERRLGIVINLLVGLTLVLAAQGIVQYFTGTGLGGQTSYGGMGGRIQSIGIFADPNDLGLAIVMVMPPLMIALIESRHLSVRTFALLALCVFGYAIYLTESRGDMMAFGVLFILFMGRYLGRGLGYGVGVVVMLAIFALGPRMSTISTGEASAYGRIEAWGVGLKLFESHPLFGVGFRDFTEYHFRTAHNSYVLCMAELGMFGLYAWMLMIYISVKNCLYIAHQLRLRGQRSLGTMVDSIQYAIIAFCLGAYWLSRTYWEPLYIMVGLSAASTQMFVSSSHEKYSLIEKRDFLMGFLLALSSYVATYVFLLFAW